jgi:hypothetical protein
MIGKQTIENDNILKNNLKLISGRIFRPGPEIRFVRSFGFNDI